MQPSAHLSGQRDYPAPLHPQVPVPSAHTSIMPPRAAKRHCRYAASPPNDMAAPEPTRRRPGPRRPRAASITSLRRGLRAASTPLQEAGEMFALFLEVARGAITNPRGYWGDVREQMYETLKLCWVRMVI